MWVIGQTGLNALDVMGFDVRTFFTDETKQQIDFYGIIAIGFGSEMIISKYVSEEIALIVFRDILESLINGEKSYDLKEREPKILKKNNIV